MTTRPTKHKIMNRQFIKKHVLSDSNPGPLPSQAYSLPQNQVCRRRKET